jgi:hypothetical protein
MAKLTGGVSRPVKRLVIHFFHSPSYTLNVLRLYEVFAERSGAKRNHIAAVMGRLNAVKNSKLYHIHFQAP